MDTPTSARAISAAMRERRPKATLSWLERESRSDLQCSALGGCTRKCARRRPALLRRKTRYLHPCCTGADLRSRYRREGGPACAVSTNRGTKPRDDRARCFLPEISKRQMRNTAPHSPVESLESRVAAFRPRRVALGRTCGGCRYALAPSASHSWPDVTGHAKLAPVARGRSFDARSCLRQTHNPVPERGLRFTFSTRESPRSPRLRRRDPVRSRGIDPGKREPPCQVLPSPAHGVSCIR